MTTFSIHPIGIVHSCFHEKFGIPRQAGISPHATAQLKLYPPYNVKQTVAGLEQSSHIWLIFLFHHHLHHAKPMLQVRPPRFGGNNKRGVFATRAPYRPNYLGLSCVELTGIEEHHGIVLHLAGVDLADQTPIIDIKPYVPFADSIPQAISPYSEEQLPLIPVRFSAAAAAFLEHQPMLQQLIVEVITADPRPAYHQDEREYGMSLAGVNIRFRLKEQVFEVFKITREAG